MTHSDAAPTVIRHPDLDTLSRGLAAAIAADLNAALGSRGLASLIVSGGRSPVRLFEHLRVLTIDWSRVCVALADERWVTPADAASNEKLVRDVLLKDLAAAAVFKGLKNDAATPEQGAAAAWQTFAGVPRPFDVVLLGMGDDGHTASLFPASPNLDAALDAGRAPACVGMQSPTAPQARLSLNLAALLDSRRIVLLITGESKWRTYVAAGRPDPVEQMPVRAVLRQRRVPVEVHWAP
jgi:6-phosphogluconolactonase